MAIVACALGATPLGALDHVLARVHGFLQPRSLDYAARFGALRLLEDYGDACEISQAAVDAAVVHGHRGVLEWMLARPLEQRCAWHSNAVWSTMAARGHADMIDWLFMRNDEMLSRTWRHSFHSMDMVAKAAASGHLEVVRRLIFDDKFSWVARNELVIKHALAVAFAHQQFTVVSFFEDHKRVRPIWVGEARTRALCNAARDNRVDLVCELRRQLRRRQLCDLDTVSKALLAAIFARARDTTRTLAQMQLFLGNLNPRKVRHALRIAVDMDSVDAAAKLLSVPNLSAEFVAEILKQIVDNDHVRIANRIACVGRRADAIAIMRLAARHEGDRSRIMCAVVELRGCDAEVSRLGMDAAFSTGDASLLSSVVRYKCDWSTFSEATERAIESRQPSLVGAVLLSSPWGDEHGRMHTLLETIETGDAAFLAGVLRKWAPGPKDIHVADSQAVEVGSADVVKAMLDAGDPMPLRVLSVLKNAVDSGRHKLALDVLRFQSFGSDDDSGMSPPMAMQTVFHSMPFADVEFFARRASPDFLACLLSRRPCTEVETKRLVSAAIFASRTEMLPVLAATISRKAAVELVLRHSPLSAMTVAILEACPEGPMDDVLVPLVKDERLFLLSDLLGRFPSEENFQVAVRAMLETERFLLLADLQNRHPHVNFAKLVQRAVLAPATTKHVRRRFKKRRITI